MAHDAWGWKFEGPLGSHFGFGMSGVFVGDMHVGDSCDNFMKVNEI